MQRGSDGGAEEDLVQKLAALPCQNIHEIGYINQKDDTVEQHTVLG